MLESYFRAVAIVVSSRSTAVKFSKRIFWLCCCCTLITMTMPLSNHRCQDNDSLACKATKKPKTISAVPSEQRMSFYQRVLPETCVAFASEEGKEIFKSALVSKGLKSFYNLIEQHHTQTEPAFCGVSTRE